jgi:hypothetical protein
MKLGAFMLDSPIELVPLTRVQANFTFGVDLDPFGVAHNILNPAYRKLVEMMMYVSFFKITNFNKNMTIVSTDNKI